MYLRSKLKSLRKFLVAACCVVVACPATAADRDAPAGYELHGQNISVRFQVVQDGLKLAEVKDRRTGTALRLEEIFSLLLRDGRMLTASQFRLSAPPTLEPIAAQRYKAHSPWSADQGAASHDLRAGYGLKIILKPFEVLTLDAEPQP
jgi:hypothetical protein